MAQGLKKISSNGVKRSKMQKTTAVVQKKKKQLSKGRKTFTPKGRKSAQAKQILSTTKAINKKNEACISAKAVSAGNKFFLNEIRETAEKELREMNMSKTKEESKSNKLSSRLKDQLRKMGQDI